MQKENDHGTRKIGLPAGLHPAVRRVRHRLRKRMEIPVDVRAVRRRRLCAAVYPVPGDPGSADHDHGVQRGPGRSGKPHPYVPAAGKEGAEMAYPRVCLLLRQRGPDGFLYGGHRLDRVLFRAVPDGTHPGAGVCRHDHRPGGQRDLSGGDGGAGLRYPVLRAAERPGAGHQIYDDAASGPDAGAGGAQLHPVRRGGGTAVLSGAGPVQDQRQRGGGGHEPGLLHPVRGHGSHGHFRQLHRKRALPDGGVGAHHRAGHLRGGGGGADHVPGLLHLWRGGKRRAQPAV